ncbi:hypothetical protein MZD29_25205, partial [Escherichia coli]|nr:hypothetical protein [Escherichia coli]MCQ6186765.1 hypothetical protein [Escherichia coli]
IAYSFLFILERIVLQFEHNSPFSSWCMCIQGALAWQEIKAGTIMIRRNPRLTKEFTLPMSKAKTKHVIAFTDRGWQKTFRIRYPF